MTVQTAILQGTRLLEDGGVAVPRLTAEVLLAHALCRDRAWLFAHGEQELVELEWLHYGRYLHQRLQGMPTQYITKRQEFYGREFRVTPDVLIPRPETEHVVEVALRHLGRQAEDSDRLSDRSLTGCPQGPAPARILDIGTGSGALAVTLAIETGAETWATEISPSAASVAARNALALGARVHIVVGDVAEAIAAGSMSLIVANPPYVPLNQRDGLQREVRDFEPHAALFAGPTGFEIYGRIVADAPRVLRPGGWLIMELGFGCEPQVRELLDGWREIEVTPDLAGIPRVIAARAAE
ncbi:MAG: peptide chain release factor N(5)-glutamine methyltransferase [Bryobacteraceae bacterium]|jgi:release factor glutamine methyltransferase